MSKSLFEIFHTAQAVRDFSELELIHIASELSIRNKDLNVTGVLYYRDREFFQILEGEKKVLDDIIKNIDDPSKHGTFHSIWQGDIEQRAFHNWGLCPYLSEAINNSDFVAKRNGLVSTSVELFSEIIPASVSR